MRNFIGGLFRLSRIAVRVDETSIGHDNNTRGKLFRTRWRLAPARLASRMRLRPTRHLTRASVLVLVGAALLLGTASPARMANTAQQTQKAYDSAPATPLSGAYRDNLLSAPFESGLQGTA